MHRLEVGQLGLIAGFDQGLERRLDQRRDAAAQQRLLAEQVGLGLLRERRLEHARSCGAEAPGVRQHAGAGRPRCVTIDGEQGRYAAALAVHAAQQVTRTLGRDHPDVDELRRRDPTEPDVEPVGEHQQLARPQVRRDIGVVDRLLGGVGDQDHDDVGRADRVPDIAHPQAGLLRQRSALRGRLQADHDVDPALAQVLGVGMALAAVADDGDGLAIEGRRVRIGVVVHARGHRFVASSMDPDPLAMTTAPVRTNSLIP